MIEQSRKESAIYICLDGWFLQAPSHLVDLQISKDFTKNSSADPGQILMLNLLNQKLCNYSWI